MTMMVTEVYNALLAAGAPEDKAARAAQALAGYDNRSNKVDTSLTIASVASSRTSIDASTRLKPISYC